MNLVISEAKIINAKALEQKLTQAFEQWVKEDIGGYFYDQFHSPVWEYGRDTTRRNPGARIKNPGAGELRDIYDYGDLYDSGKDVSLSFKSSAIEASWNWDAKNSSGRAYAYYVHEGVGTNFGYPRPWTDIFADKQRFEGSRLKKELLERIRALGTRG